MHGIALWQTFQDAIFLIFLYIQFLASVRFFDVEWTTFPYT